MTTILYYPFKLNGESVIQAQKETLTALVGNFSLIEISLYFLKSCDYMTFLYPIKAKFSNDLGVTTLL